MRQIRSIFVEEKPEEPASAGHQLGQLIGVWLVKRDGRSSTLTAYLDDLGGCDLRVVTELSKKYDDLVDLLIEAKNTTITDLASDIITLLSKHDHKQPDETW